MDGGWFTERLDSGLRCWWTNTLTGEVVQLPQGVSPINYLLHNLGEFLPPDAMEQLPPCKWSYSELVVGIVQDHGWHLARLDTDRLCITTDQVAAPVLRTILNRVGRCSTLPAVEVTMPGRSLHLGRYDLRRFLQSSCLSLPEAST